MVNVAKDLALLGMMVIGFTGTRGGMSHEQTVRVIKLLIRMYAQTMCRSVGLHGDCIGADADFDALCRGLGIKTTCRPCTLEKFRARTPAEVIAEPVHPMERNRIIIADADVMIACPPNKERIKRGSGTWATIGFAEKANVPLHIVFPDGEVEFKE